MSREQRVAVLGATGMVGREMLRTLEERSFPVSELRLLASPKSAGHELSCQGRSLTVEAVSDSAFDGIDLALFSAGSAASKAWAPRAAAAGATVIDNSSAWRLDAEVPLVVPEVNADALAHRPKGIIANPNCSTIQMLVALAPIHRALRLTRIVVATYQAISGAGKRASADLERQIRSWLSREAVAPESLGGQLAGNLLMGWTPDPMTGYTEEELKMIRETQKIFADATIAVSPTAVRVPVLTGHAEAISVTTRKPTSAKEVRRLLESAPGVRLMDDLLRGVYPTPKDAEGTDDVLVGRIRDDLGSPGGVQLFVVADNLRKGAALNAVQIAERLIA